MTTELNTELTFIEINPQAPAEQCIIWMHGLGADGNDFVPIARELNLTKTRFIFPNALFRPITINQGYVMRAWYDITAMQFEREVDENSIYESIKLINALIEKEKTRGMTSEKIILAGFSQGAVMALTAGLCYPERLGGIIALSGYLVMADQLAINATPANRTTPIFLAHGTQDSIVAYSLGIMVNDFLKKHHYDAEMHTYTMGHSVSAEEVSDIAHWLSTR